LTGKIRLRNDLLYVLMETLLLYAELNRTHSSLARRAVAPKYARISAHVTRNSDTIFKVKRSKVNLQGGGGVSE